MVAGKRLEHNVVSGLRIRRPIPRAVESDKHAVSVALGKLLFVVVHHPVRRPVSRKCGDRSDFIRAHADLLPAVATVFRRQNQLLHERVEVALGPTVVAALFQKHHLFGRESGFLIRFIKVGPIRMQLIPSVLRAEHASRCINGEALVIADPGCEALGWRKDLVGLVCVIEPDATSSLEFLAGIGARRFERPILQLAGITRRSHIHVQSSCGIDDKWMHGMIAGQRQSRKDRDAGTVRHD